MATDGKHASKLQWSEQYSVGIPEIDEQHKTLFDLVNMIHAAILDHKGTAACVDVLNELVDYTRSHFGLEESLMRIGKYPGYADHCALHQELIDEVETLMEKIHSGKAAISFELLHFLRVWLTKHILGEDKKYGDFFNSGEFDGIGTRKRKKRWWQFW